MNVAVIFAGGVGARMNSRAVPKQFLEILGEYRDHLVELLRRYGIGKARRVVAGGGTGQQSRHNALNAVAQDCPEDTIVLIHDGVRPLINAELISANIESVVMHGSGITC